MRPVLRRYGPDPAQFGELWLPGGTSAATVVIVHGGFWRARYDLSLGRPLAADLVRRGYAVWNLEYRRAGAAGGWPATAWSSRISPTLCWLSLSKVRRRFTKAIPRR
ncbi:MAG: hypothetical protein WBF34_29100, partial [Streptosporangiaceae bacterium]